MIGKTQQQMKRWYTKPRYLEGIKDKAAFKKSRFDGFVEEAALMSGYLPGRKILISVGYRKRFAIVSGGEANDQFAIVMALMSFVNICRPGNPWRQAINPFSPVPVLIMQNAPASRGVCM